MPAPIRFPTAAELPAELRVDASTYENRWLCDGQVRTWAGETMAIEAAVSAAQSRAARHQHRHADGSG